MRDLINLIEGVGLTNRKPGEQFKNHVDDIVTYQNMEFYPESGAYADPSELVQAKVDAIDKTGRNVHWVNQANATTRGLRGGYTIY